MEVKFDGTIYYTIEDLASAVGVTSKTIKEWEKRGYLPQSYRHPIRNWRLYTQEEIDQLVQLAKSHNYFRDTPKDTTHFQ